MSTLSKKHAIAAAMAVAEDVAEGRLSPVDLEAQAITELTALVRTVVGPDDLMFELQVEICRGVLAAGGIPAADELQEWVAVAKRRESRAAGKGSGGGGSGLQ